MPSGAVAATAVPPGLRARRGIRAPGVHKSPKPAVVRVTSVPGGPFSTARPGMDARPHGPMDAAVGGPNSAFGD